MKTEPRSLAQVSFPREGLGKLRHSPKNAHSFLLIITLQVTHMFLRLTWEFAQLRILRHPIVYYRMDWKNQLCSCDPEVLFTLAQCKIQEQLRVFGFNSNVLCNHCEIQLPFVLLLLAVKGGFVVTSLNILCWPIFSSFRSWVLFVCLLACLFWWHNDLKTCLLSPDSLIMDGPLTPGSKFSGEPGLKPHVFQG